MQVFGFSKVVLSAGVIALLFMGGCRSATADRMRHMEAEMDDMERQNRELQGELAAAKAKELQLQAEADREKARAEAAGARAEAATTYGSGFDPSELDGIKGVDVRASRDGATIVLASDVTFTAGRADLSKRAEKILRQVAQKLSADDVRTIRVEGHTDSDPIRRSGWKDNKELSLARAKIVQQYLVSKGVSEEILTVAGMGATKPVATNKTADGKTKNRRVEIIVVND
jgi:flagellar motor protein MotB